MCQVCLHSLQQHRQPLQWKSQGVATGRTLHFRHSKCKWRMLLVQLPQKLDVSLTWSRKSLPALRVSSSPRVRFTALEFFYRSYRPIWAFRYRRYRPLAAA
eukprot:s1959_g4.t1